MKGGIGTVSLRRGEVIIAALCVVNAAGDILDFRTGRIIAGARTADGKGFANSAELLQRDLEAGPSARLLDDRPFRATTLTVVATNVALDKTSLTKLAMMVNTGAARAINPYHTQGDGDQIIALSTNRLTRDVSLTAIGSTAALAARMQFAAAWSRPPGSRAGPQCGNWRGEAEPQSTRAVDWLASSTATASGRAHAVQTSHAAEAARLTSGRGH